MKLKLNNPFASNISVDEFDTRQMKRALNYLGYYTPPKALGITDIPDRAVFEALKAFQKDNDLAPTGTAKPGDATEEKVSQKAEEAEGEVQYIWRTAQDDKVRASHAALEGETRTLGDFPDPGEEYNCRCSAEIVRESKKKKKPCFSRLAWEDESKDFIRQHEGNSPWPYVDTAGKITVGIGINIDKKESFKSLPWKLYDESNGPPASDGDIQIAYDNLRNFISENSGKKTGFNNAYTIFENVTPLRLSQETREKLFGERYNILRDELEHENFSFEVFDCFPPPAKIALMDMHFNMGMTRFNKAKWPRLFESANNRDWMNVAPESHRRGVAQGRNTNTFKKFVEAADMETDG